MATIRLYSHAPSDTIQRLKAELIAAGHNCKKLRTEGGTYRGRDGHIVLNYGSSRLPAQTIGTATVLNEPANINGASNKRHAFTSMERGNVRTVEYTTQRQIAEQWVREGALVYVRTQLSGHSGEGIQLAYQNPTALGDAGDLLVTREVPDAPLYTKGILGNRREYRVHIFKGKIIHVAQKRRRDGFAQIEGNNNLVRNHHTGWVYSTQNMTALNHAGQCEALKAMAALGLDFGAVDIITNREQAWVLEVNTAPGMEGVTLEKYVAAISAVAEGREVEGTTVEGYADFRQTPVEVDPNASDRTPAQRAQGNRPAPVVPADVQEARARGGRPQTPNNQSQTAPAQQAPAQQAAPAAPQTRTTGTGRRGPALANGNYYFITMNGEETVGKYVAATNAFEIIGWEPQVEVAEVTVVSVINRG